jgi:hypothetical protein
MLLYLDKKRMSTYHYSISKLVIKLGFLSFVANKPFKFFKMKLKEDIYLNYNFEFLQFVPNKISTLL